MTLNFEPFCALNVALKGGKITRAKYMDEWKLLQEKEAKRQKYNDYYERWEGRTAQGSAK